MFIFLFKLYYVSIKLYAFSCFQMKNIILQKWKFIQNYDFRSVEYWQHIKSSENNKTFSESNKKFFFNIWVSNQDFLIVKIKTIIFYQVSVI